MQEPIAVNPFKCRVWSLHERLEGDINEETCRDEIESFLKHGQLIPVLGRYVHDDPNYEVELIYGARRLFVARHINRPLLVHVQKLSDKEAIVAMDAENRLRKDVSPYERGLSYAYWLRSGQFGSQGDIAHALNVSESQVSRLLKLARLPAVIVGAFRSAAEIRESWGLEIMEGLDDPARREGIIRVARSLNRKSPRLLSVDVYRQLSAPEIHGKKMATAHDKVVRGTDGTPLFRVRYQNSSIALIVPTEKISRESLAQIETNVASILQEATRGSRELGGFETREANPMDEDFSGAVLTQAARPRPDAFVSRAAVV